MPEIRYQSAGAWKQITYAVVIKNLTRKKCHSCECKAVTVKQRSSVFESTVMALMTANLLPG